MTLMPNKVTTVNSQAISAMVWCVLAECTQGHWTGRLPSKENRITMSWKVKDKEIFVIHNPVGQGRGEHCACGPRPTSFLSQCLLQFDKAVWATAMSLQIKPRQAKPETKSIQSNPKQSKA